LSDFNEYEIPITSPLEVSQENTVVPVGQPTFTANAQAVASNMLANSIKWERDGYFMGWHGYQFSLFTTDTKYTLEPHGQLYSENGVLLKAVTDTFYSLQSNYDKLFFNFSFLQGIDCLIGVPEYGYVDNIASYNDVDGDPVMKFVGRTRLYYNVEIVLKLQDSTIKSFSLEDTHNIKLETYPNYRFEVTPKVDAEDYFLYRQAYIDTSVIDLDFMGIMGTGYNRTSQTLQLGDASNYLAITINDDGTWVDGTGGNISGAGAWWNYFEKLSYNHYHYTIIGDNTEFADDRDIIKYRSKEDLIAQFRVGTDSKTWQFRGNATAYYVGGLTYPNFEVLGTVSEAGPNSDIGPNGLAIGDGQVVTSIKADNMVFNVGTVQLRVTVNDYHKEKWLRYARWAPCIFQSGVNSSGTTAPLFGSYTETATLSQRYNSGNSAFAGDSWWNGTVLSPMDAGHFTTLMSDAISLKVEVLEITDPKGNTGASSEYNYWLAGYCALDTTYPTLPNVLDRLQTPAMTGATGTTITNYAQPGAAYMSPSGSGLLPVPNIGGFWPDYRYIRNNITNIELPFVMVAFSQNFGTFAACIPISIIAAPKTATDIIDAVVSTGYIGLVPGTITGNPYTYTFLTSVAIPAISLGTISYNSTSSEMYLSTGQLDTLEISAIHKNNLVSYWEYDNINQNILTPLSITSTAPYIFDSNDPSGASTAERTGVATSATPGAYDFVLTDILQIREASSGNTFYTDLVLTIAGADCYDDSGTQIAEGTLVGWAVRQHDLSTEYSLQYKAIGGEWGIKYNQHSTSSGGVWPFNYTVHYNNLIDYTVVLGNTKVGKGSYSLGIIPPNINYMDIQFGNLGFGTAALQVISQCNSIQDNSWTHTTYPINGMNVMATTSGELPLAIAVEAEIESTFRFALVGSMYTYIDNKLQDEFTRLTTSTGAFEVSYTGSLGYPIVDMAGTTVDPALGEPIFFTVEFGDPTVTGNLGAAYVAPAYTQHVTITATTLDGKTNSTSADIDLEDTRLPQFALATFTNLVNWDVTSDLQLVNQLTGYLVQVEKASYGTEPSLLGIWYLKFRDNTEYDLVIQRAIIELNTGSPFFLPTYNQALIQFTTTGIYIPADLSNTYYDQAHQYTIDDVDGLLYAVGDDLLVLGCNYPVVNIALNDSLVFDFTPSGVWNWSRTVQYITNSTNSITFRYNNVEYVLTLLEEPDTKFTADAVDMRTLESVKMNVVTPGRVIMQSAWADPDVEYYWYIDANHIFVLRYRTCELLTRDPDSVGFEQTYKWNVTASVPRIQYIPEDAVRYTFTSAYNDTPRLVYFKIRNETTVEIYHRSIEVTNFTNPTPFPNYYGISSTGITGLNVVTLNPITFGFPPITDAISYYEPYITAQDLIYQCKLSSTVTQNHLLIGIWLNKALKQWSLDFKLTANTQKNGPDIVATGYGFVGIDGKLTGSALPIVNVSKSGYNGVVYDVKDIKLANYGTYAIKDAIYFYYAYVNGLVYHLEFQNQKWTPVAVGLRSSAKMVSASSKSTNLKNESSVGFYGIWPYIGQGVSVTNTAYACAVSCASTWLSRNSASDIISFTEKQQIDSPIPDLPLWYKLAQGAIPAGASLAKQASQGTLENGTGLQTAIDVAITAGMPYFQQESDLAVAAGPVGALQSVADMYSVGNDSSIYAGPGFVGAQVVQIHYVGGAGEYFSKKKTQGMNLVLPVPGILAGVSSGFSGIMNAGLAGLQPYSTGAEDSFEQIRIPSGRLGYRHLYLHYPTEAKQSVLSDSRLKCTIEEKYKPTLTIEKGQSSVPRGYAVIEGCSDILLDVDFLGTKRVTEPVFSDPYVYDYCIDKNSGLYYSAIDGAIVATSVDDTKVLDGEPSNVLIKGLNVYMGSSYVALEVRDTGDINMDYLRPKVASPAVMYWNTTGYNILYNFEIKHGFDAYFMRILSLHGTAGMDVEKQTLFYSYLVSGPMKVGTHLPQIAFFGSFVSAPNILYDWPIEIWIEDNVYHREVYVTPNARIEDRDADRYSIPIIHQRLALLPATIKTIAAYKLYVIDGVTSLTTDIRNTNGLTRKANALDFTVYGQIYRWNDEYISKINQAFGIQDIRDIVATLGLDYVGSTPTVAWFYSPALRAFYNFTAAEDIKKLFYAFRFYNVDAATWDFVAQEVVFRTETDKGTMLPRIDTNFMGEIYPISKMVGENVFYSMAGGMTFQGLNRFQVNRFLLLDSMVETNGDQNMTIEGNRMFFNDATQEYEKKWVKVPGEDLNDFWMMRHYKSEDDPDATAPKVDGYIVEPFRLATAYLGTADRAENQYEWMINFALTDIMNKVWKDRYVIVYLAAETMTEGGYVKCKPTKVRLRKDMFTRRGDFGYYSFKFTSMNGAGNAERLYIWSDDLIAIRSLYIRVKPITTDRHNQLLTEPDFRDDTEW